VASWLFVVLSLTDMCLCISSIPYRRSHEKAQGGVDDVIREDFGSYQKMMAIFQDLALKGMSYTEIISHPLFKNDKSTDQNLKALKWYCQWLHSTGKYPQLSDCADKTTE